MPSAAVLRLEIERALAGRFPAALTPAPRTIREVAPTGIAQVDELLDGGLPIGAISELTGPESSGRTSLAQAFLAARTAEGRVCAWVDVNDAFDPESAAANGVALRQVLWVRCLDRNIDRNPQRNLNRNLDRNLDRNAPTKKPLLGQPHSTQPSPRPWTRLDQALRSTDLLLQAGGFAAIVFDLGATAREHANRIPAATWFRFRQAADRARCSLVVLGRAAYAQSSAAVVLECARQQAPAAGETVLRGFKFLVRSRPERFAARFTPIDIGTRKPGPPRTGLSPWGGKPPASTWQAHAAWEAQRRA